MTTTRRILVPLALTATLLAIACDSGNNGERSAGPASESDRNQVAQPSSVSESTPRPNLLLISLDTVRADSLGVYGQEKVVTPHIDAFAEQGVLFERCVSSSPSTLPSHASIFTGRHPFAHGVRANAGYSLHESELTLAEVLSQNGYRTRAEVASQVMTEATRLNQGFDAYHGVEADDVERLRLRVSDGANRANGAEDRRTEQMARPASDVTRHAIRFLETAEAVPNPFFLWLHYFDPHRPHTPPPRFAARLPDNPYLAEVAYTDNAIGDVLTALIRLDLADDTLVVITSDHGEGLGEHGEQSHSYFLYDTTVRVPLIMSGPGLTPGKRITPLVRTVDIAPTILDLLGLPPLDASQGVSLRPLMEDREIESLAGYGESIELFKAFGDPVLRFIREDDWKYIHTSPPELYDLAADPGELDNAAPREPERTARLRESLAQLLSGTTARQSARSEVDPQTRARLEALGYLGSAAPELPNELESLTLADAPAGHSQAADVTQLSRAAGAATYGNHKQAAEFYRDLRTRHPRSPELLRRLVAALYHQQDPEAASQDEIVALYDDAAELDRDNAELLVQLAELSALGGQIGGALSALRRALELEPCAALPRSALVRLLHRARRHLDHFEAARQGVLQCPDLPSALNDMAWVFATSPLDEMRDGAQAISLAERALSFEPDNLSYRDTLAAGYAETGNYQRASLITQQIIAELEQVPQVPAAILAEFRRHLAEFEARRPLRD